MKTPEFNFPEPSSDQRGEKRCVFCGGTALISGARLLDQTRNHEMSIKVGKDKTPEAMIFKGRERSDTVALVCETCGYLHLFATSPKRVRMAGGPG